MNPAIEWLQARFQQLAKRRAAAGDKSILYELDYGPWRGSSCVRPMIDLLPLMDAGQPMHVIQADYHDPERWWL